MARQTQFSRSLPRAELEHRAREARSRLIEIERLLVPRASPRAFSLSPLVRLLGSRAGGDRRNDNRQPGPWVDDRPMPQLFARLGVDLVTKARCFFLLNLISRR